jgi:hypothetical protein
MFVNFWTLFIIFWTLVAVQARFNLETCWSKDCIRQNDEGTWCYFPPPGETRATVCDSRGADFTTVLGVHRRQGFSIGYYNGVDNALLGGADWSLPANPGVVRLCVSGATGAGTYQTLCVNAVADNTLSNSPYCQVALGQDNVTDGCYIYHSTTTSKATATPTSNYSNGARGLRLHSNLAMDNAWVLFFSTLLASLHSLCII